MVRSTPEAQSAAPLQLFQRITGFWATQALAVADLGLADHFPDGPRSSDDLARAVGAHPASLYRLLRALTSIDVMVKIPPASFASPRSAPA